MTRGLGGVLTLPSRGLTPGIFYRFISAHWVSILKKMIQGCSTLFESNIANIKNAGLEDSLTSNGGTCNIERKAVNINMFWWQYSYETGTYLSCKDRSKSGLKDYMVAFIPYDQPLFDWEMALLVEDIHQYWHGQTSACHHNRSAVLNLGLVDVYLSHKNTEAKHSIPM